MNKKTSSWTRGLALCGVAAIGLGLATSSSARDRDDLITTASTAGTTAYIVGKNIDDDFAQAQDFADTQSVALRREAATGEGENLDALAALLHEENPDAFGQWMQSNYSTLYGPDVAAESNVVDRIVAMR
ncbi:DUF3015 family protein [uncultured Salinisphaera sp.]|uniref:DUF3015 family protein n=1 Tax=Salinisphaera sp. C84B14 TaxID=1304155 RepID=UPI0032B1321C